MSDQTRIPTEPCKACYAGRVPTGGHTVQELREEAMARIGTPRPEFAARIEAAKARRAEQAGRT